MDKVHFLFGGTIGLFYQFLKALLLMMINNCLFDQFCSAIIVYTNISAVPFLNNGKTPDRRAFTVTSNDTLSFLWNIQIYSEIWVEYECCSLDMFNISMCGKAKVSNCMWVLNYNKIWFLSNVSSIGNSLIYLRDVQAKCNVHGKSMERPYCTPCGLRLRKLFCSVAVEAIYENDLLFKYILLASLLICT